MPDSSFHEDARARCECVASRIRSCTQWWKSESECSLWRMTAAGPTTGAAGGSAAVLLARGVY